MNYDHMAHMDTSHNHGTHMHMMHNHTAMTMHTNSNMDHGNTSSDHGDHTGHGVAGGHETHGMVMAFHFGYQETILFESWKINSVGGLIGSVIGIIIMAALYEGLKYYREYLFWRTYNALQYRSVSIPQEKNVVADNNQVIHMVDEVIHKQPPTMLSWMHTFQTFLHIVQIVLSYFLMLIFMTYNVWLCFAVVVGAAIGYFLFGWKKSVIVDVTEHCH